MILNRVGSRKPLSAERWSLRVGRWPFSVHNAKLDGMRVEGGFFEVFVKNRVFLLSIS